MGLFSSKPRFDHTPRFEHFNCLIEIAPGFWNVRAPFYVLGRINIGTHMSIVELGPDQYAALDCIELSAAALRELNELLGSPNNLVAVITTHPFHTLAIPSFHAIFPSTAGRRYYGCPRHLIKCTQDANGRSIEWSGNLNECSSRRAFEPALRMAIPDGAEFIDPKPPTRNHLATVLVLHTPSRTVHVDDCLNFIDNMGLLPRLALGNKTLIFHPSLLHSGLHETAEAPLAFRQWVERTLVNEWDYDTLCTAHNGLLRDGAKAEVAALLRRTDAALKKRSIKNALADAERTADAMWDGSGGAPSAVAATSPATGRAGEVDAQCQDCWSDVDVECG